MAFEYFDLAELRAWPDMADAAKYPDAKLSDAHDWIVAVIERETTTSFVARTVDETVDGDSQDCRGGLMLSARYVLDVTAVTSNGAAFDAGQLAELSVRSGGMGARVYRREAGTYTGHIPWDAGTRNIEITYEAGYSALPPADLLEAALQGARDRVLRTASQSGLNDRTLSVTNQDGTYQLSTPGERRPTGLPEVDSVIMAWAKKVKPRWSVG